MRSRRRQLIALVIVAAFILAVGLVAPFWPNDGPGVTTGNYRRIQPGMTRGEVDGLLGGSSVGEVHVSFAAPPIPPSDLMVFWGDDRKMIQVFFLQGRVTYKNWARFPSSGFPIDYLRWRLGI